MEYERAEPFGERFGFTQKPSLQYDTLNDETRTDLFNELYWLVFIFPNEIKTAAQHDISDMLFDLKQGIWTRVLKQNILDYKERNIPSFIREEFGNRARFYEVFQFIERTFDLLPTEFYPIPDIVEILNACLIRNSVAWRLNQANQFVPVSNESELKEINFVIENSETNNLPTVAAHLKTAIQMLSGKPDADKLRLSIKESISMVGVIARKIAGEDDLGKALYRLEKAKLVTASLKDKFKNYYTYTSGKNGIRHELMEEEKLDYEEAKYFLIACSAFTNYLIEKAIKAKLL